MFFIKEKTSFYNFDKNINNKLNLICIIFYESMFVLFFFFHSQIFIVKSSKADIKKLFPNNASSDNSEPTF